MRRGERVRGPEGLSPDFLVYPENGAISTFKGFEIIVIGGLIVLLVFRPTGLFGERERTA